MIDPRTKFALTIVSILSFFLLPSKIYFLAFLGVIHLIFWLSGVENQNVIKVWKTILPISLFILIFWFLFTPSKIDPFWKWGFLSLGRDNIDGFIHMITRLWAIVFACYYPMLTSKQSTALVAFVKMGMPYHWAFTIVLALESVQDLTSRWQQVKLAQQVRGVDLTKGNPFKRAMNLLPLLTAVIVSSLRDSEQLTFSLINRGMDSRVKRTWLEDPTLRWFDWLILALLTSAVICLIIVI